MTTTQSKQRKEIADRLRLERERLGYSSHQISQLLGVSDSVYASFENGQGDPGLYNLPRLAACGFDILFIATNERHTPMEEENELLRRFRELSQRGRTSIFTTLDALERLAPNIKQTIRGRFKR